MNVFRHIEHSTDMKVKHVQRMRMQSALAFGLVVAASLPMAGCGGSTKPPETPVAADVDAPKETAAKPQKNRAQVAQELGEIDPQETERAFGRVQGKLMACHKAGLRRIDALAGDLKFFVRIGQDGKTRYAYLEDSSLGDAETEKCMLDAVALAPWPKPQGGEAEARKAYSFDAGDAREPTVWEREKVQVSLAKYERELKSCTGDLNGSFQVTMYVEPDKKDGKVAAVGMAIKSQAAAAKITCLTEVLRGMKLPSPGSYTAKVSFPL